MESNLENKHQIDLKNLKYAQVTAKIRLIEEADEEIRTLDPLLGKEMLYH